MFANPLLELIYPRLCCACESHLQQNEDVLCTYCHYHLPKTWFHRWPDNPLAKVFWGRIMLEKVFAFYFYTKGGKVQHVLHQLKYNNRPELGVYLGKLFAGDLLKDDAIQDIDFIVPVPLHPGKQRRRGYNQSECFANGLSEGSLIPTDTRSLVRRYSSETQTRKSRYKRWENVKEIFAVDNPASLENKHILLVDDVITTGATIEACGIVLNAIPNIKLSVAAIATAI